MGGRSPRAQVESRTPGVGVVDRSEPLCGANSVGCGAVESCCDAASDRERMASPITQ